jgi:hypothetical protein
MINHEKASIFWGRKPSQGAKILEHNLATDACVQQKTSYHLGT